VTAIRDWNVAFFSFLFHRRGFQRIFRCDLTRVDRSGRPLVEGVSIVLGQWEIFSRVLQLRVALHVRRIIGIVGQAKAGHHRTQIKEVVGHEPFRVQSDAETSECGFHDVDVQGKHDVIGYRVTATHQHGLKKRMDQTQREIHQIVLVAVEETKEPYDGRVQRAHCTAVVQRRVLRNVTAAGNPTERARHVVYLVRRIGARVARVNNLFDVSQQRTQFFGAHVPFVVTSRTPGMRFDRFFNLQSECTDEPYTTRWRPAKGLDASELRTFPRSRHSLLRYAADVCRGPTFLQTVYWVWSTPERPFQNTGRTTKAHDNVRK